MPRFAFGGVIPPRPHGDSIPVLLSPGCEHLVLDAKTIEANAKHYRDILTAINANALASLDPS